MAKKKHQGKKHKFKYAADTNEVQVATSHLQPAAAPDRSEGVAVAPIGAKPSSRPVSSVMTAGRDFSYVAVDLKRILILMAALVVLEFVLWGLMSGTGLGSAIQGLIKL